MNRIDALFQTLKREGRRALMPFITAGDPDLATTSALLSELLTRGAHMVEIGVPYSDPIADGPVISASYTRALGKGIRLAQIFAMIREWRNQSAGGPQAQAPLVTMVSYAIVFKHGVEKYLSEAAAAGVDGLIVPDLPVEEAESLLEQAQKHGLCLIQLITPTTPRERALRIARATTGFIYYVSVAGITGERKRLPTELTDDVSWLRSQTDLPVCIGFGISSPEHVRELAPVADGLIVGSAIVRRLAESGGRSREQTVAEIGEYVATLAEALKSRTTHPARESPPGS